MSYAKREGDFCKCWAIFVHTNALGSYNRQYERCFFLVQMGLCIISYIAAALAFPVFAWMLNFLPKHLQRNSLYFVRSFNVIYRVPGLSLSPKWFKLTSSKVYSKYGIIYDCYSYWNSCTPSQYPYPEPLVIQWQSSGKPVCLERRPQCIPECHWRKNWWQPVCFQWSSSGDLMCSNYTN